MFSCAECNMVDDTYFFLTGKLFLSLPPPTAEWNELVPPTMWAVTVALGNVGNHSGCSRFHGLY